MNFDFGRIAVGIRATRTHAEFLWSVLRLVRSGLRAEDEVLEPAGDLPHHYAAEMMVSKFLKSKCDTLLALDDDMRFAPDMLEALRSNPANWEYGVLGALYPVRRPPFRPILMAETAPSEYAEIQLLPDMNTIEVAVVGLGFTLIRREVVETIRAKRPGLMLFAWPDDGQTGEDCFFCRLARASGFKIGVDTRVCPGHSTEQWAMVDRVAHGVQMASIDDRPFRHLLAQLRETRQASENKQKET